MNTSRPEIGTKLDVPGYGFCEVVSTSDPSLITLRTAHGTEFRIGEKLLQLALLAARGEDVRPTV